MKIGVIGAGHLGRIHISQILEVEGLELIGFFDSDPNRVFEISKEFGIKSFSSPEVLINSVDAIDIVTPTLSHFDIACKAIRESKHVFIEKPLVNTIEEAEKLIKLTGEADVKVQVGHVERFNPAFVSVQNLISNPMFIESHRLAQFNPRGTDVPVILDLMIHDIDIVLSVVKSNIRKISASGVAVVSDSPDIANARLEFDNGCVANLTASRISLKNMRKTRIFQKDAYVSVDFLTKESEIVRMKPLLGEPDPLSMYIDLGNEKGKKEIYFEKPQIVEHNAIREELRSFMNSIINDEKTVVTIEDGYQALNIAYQVLEKMRMTGDGV